MARGSARLAALGLLCAGWAYFAGAIGAIADRPQEVVLAAAALAVLLHLTLTVDPAWLLSAGIVSTMFAGHWEKLGLNASVGPHRVLLAAAIAALLLRAPPVRARPSLVLDGVHFALAAALGYAAVSAFVVGALDEENARFVLIDQFGVLPFVMFTIAPLAFRTERQRNILLGSLVATGAYLSITAVLEKLDLYDLVYPRYIADPTVGQHFGRARGPFVEAAADGLALYACAVAGAVAFFVWRRPWHRMAAAVVALAAPLGVLLTVTRGVWLAAVVATLVAMAGHRALRRWLVPVAAAGIAGVLAAFALIPGLARDAEERQNDKAPIHERQNTNAAGLRMLADRPFTGFGWDRANANMESYFRMHPDIPLIGARAGLHNVYLHHAISLGLAGFVLWATALCLAFGRALTWRAPPTLLPWRAGLSAVVVAWLVVGMFTPGHFAFSAYLVWTWAGVLYRRPVAAPPAVAEHDEGDRPAPDPTHERVLPR